MANFLPEQPYPGKMSDVVLSELELIYADPALVTRSAPEVVIDFAQEVPRAGHGKIKSRTVVVPMNAKLLLPALGEHLARYQQHSGEIAIPGGHPLAGELFRSTQDDGDSKEDS